MTTGISDIRTSLAAVFLSVSGMAAELTNFSNPSSPIDLVDIPGFYINQSTRAQHEHRAGRELTSARTFFAIVIIAEIPDDDPVGKESAYAAMQPFLDAIPLAFLAHWALLGSDGLPLPDVVGITSLMDDLPEEIVREGKRYAAVPYRVSVTMNRSL